MISCCLWSFLVVEDDDGDSDDDDVGDGDSDGDGDGDDDDDDGAGDDDDGGDGKHALRFLSSLFLIKSHAMAEFQGL